MSFGFPFLPRYPRILLAIGLALLVFYARSHLSRMDNWLFQPSWAGTKALVLYLVGDYNAAARAYRVHFREAARSGLDMSDVTSDAILRGDLATAKIEVQKLLAGEPQNPAALLGSGIIALEEGNPVQALEAFRHVLQQNPEHADALVYTSIAHAQTGEYNDAIDEVNHTLRNARVGSGPLSFLMFLETTGDLEDLPPSKKPLCLLAHYYRYLRIFDPTNSRPAIRYAKRAIAAGDRPAEAYLTIGVVYEKTDQPERALETFQKAIEIDPHQADALWWSGILYSRRGDAVNAYRMNKAAFDAKPNESFYLRNLHLVLVDKLGDYQQAIAILEGVVAVRPDDVTALERLGHVYGFIDYGRAANIFRRVLQLDPNNAYAHARLGYNLGHLGQVEAAIASYRKALELEPYKVENRASLAHLYFHEYRNQEAAQEYEVAIRMGERDITSRVQLCLSYHILAQYQNAINCFQAVLVRDPGNPTARHVIGESRHNLQLLTARS